MSMCLYITRGRQAELLRLTRNQDAMASLTMSSIVGRMKSMGAFQEPEAANVLGQMDFGEEAIEKQLDEMSREAWRQGIFQGLYAHFAKGQMREDFRQAQSLLQSFQTQLSGSQAAPGEPEGGHYLDLHKSWQVLHYLFTGTAWDGLAPANTLLKGGKTVGEDLGYGPARVVDAAATRAFAQFLNPLSPERLNARIDMKKMARLQIYCAQDGGDLDDLQEDVEHFFPMLKDYVGTAAAKGESLAIWVT